VAAATSRGTLVAGLLATRLAVVLGDCAWVVATVLALPATTARVVVPLVAGPLAAVVAVVVTLPPQAVSKAAVPPVAANRSARRRDTRLADGFAVLVMLHLPNDVNERPPYDES